MERETGLEPRDNHVGNVELYQLSYFSLENQSLWKEKI